MELVFAIVLLTISVVWLIFPFIVNSWLKQIYDEIAKGNQEVRSLLQQATKSNVLMEQAIALNKKQAQSSVTKQTAPVPISFPLPAQTLTISRDGENIGEFTLTNVKHMLKNKQLTLQDMYFDSATQEWVALELNPSLY